MYKVWYIRTSFCKNVFEKFIQSVDVWVLELFVDNSAGPITSMTREITCVLLFTETANTDLILGLGLGLPLGLILLLLVLLLVCLLCRRHRRHRSSTDSDFSSVDPWVFPVTKDTEQAGSFLPCKTWSFHFTTFRIKILKNIPKILQNMVCALCLKFWNMNKNRLSN